MVVTALRLKFRRTSPGLICAGLVVLLGLAVAILNHNADRLPLPYGRMLLLVIVGGLFLLCGLISLTTVSSSLNSEVANRTLEFQKIVSLPPRQILLGKIIGEPTLSYFLILSTIPFAIFGWFLGGATAAVIALLYLNLLTFCFMMAAVATIHTLREPTQSTGHSNSNGSLGWLFFIPMFILPQVAFGGGGQALTNGWLATPLGLLTPLASLVQLSKGDAWLAKVSLWSFELPSLVIAPLFQLLVAWLSIRVMSRRLENAERPLLSKPLAYGLLIVIDFIAAGFVMHERVATARSTDAVWIFAAIHLIAVLMLILFTTPRAEMLKREIWRKRGCRYSPLEIATSDRTPISLSLLIFCLIAGLVAIVGMMLPSMTSRFGLPISWPEVGQVLFIVSLLTLSVGGLLQTCAAYSSNNNGIALGLFATLILAVVPLLTAITARVNQLPGNESFLFDILFSISPIAFWIEKFQEVPPRINFILPVLVMFYSVVGLVCVLLRRRWMESSRVIVRDKLIAMGVQP